MIIFPVVLASAVLVTLGYLASWSSMHENTSKGLAGFGRVMALIMYLFAGLILLFGISMSRHYPGHWGMMQQGGCGMMGSMDKGRAMDMHGGPVMHEMDESHGVRDMTAAMPGANKDEMMRHMREWKKNNPKEWQESVKELNAEK